MPVMLGYHTLRGSIAMCDAIDLLERAFAREAEAPPKAIAVSPKFVTEYQGYAGG